MLEKRGFQFSLGKVVPYGELNGDDVEINTNSKSNYGSNGTMQNILASIGLFLNFFKK